MTGYLDFDASPDHVRVGVTDGRRNEGITIDSRSHPAGGGDRWSDDAWQHRVDLHLRQADNIAQILDTYVSYNQLWCEVRAKEIGYWHRMPDHLTGRAEEDAERERWQATHGPLGAGECVLTGCTNPVHAEAGGLRLCMEHYHEVRDIGA